MNQKQRISLIIGLVLFISVALFPAYEGIYQLEGDNMKFYLGHHPVFLPPSDAHVLDAMFNTMLSSDKASWLDEDYYQYICDLFWSCTLSGEDSARFSEAIYQIKSVRSADLGFIYSYVLLSETILELVTVIALTVLFAVLFNKPCTPEMVASAKVESVETLGK